MVSIICSVLLLSTVYGAVSGRTGTKAFENNLRKFLDRSQCFQNCIKGSTLRGLTRHATNRGLHRELVTTVQLYELVHSDVNETIPHNCGVMLIEQLPSSLYVDLDQVADLTRVGGLKLLHFDSMDVEKPAHLSHSHIILVFHSLSPSAKNKSMWSAEVHLPIHIRYHSPNEGGIPAEVKLPTSTVLLSCVSGQVEYNLFDSIDCNRICDGDGQFEAPCWWSESLATCNWQLLPFQVSEPLVFHIPVGNTLKWTLVANTTIVVTIACCIALCWALWKTKNDTAKSKLHRH